MAFPDVMVDIETTGTSPDEAAIIQIAAVRFNLSERTIDNADMFNRCLSLPPKRYWDESTRDWWAQQKRSVLLGILQRGEDPGAVVKAFSDWARDGANGETLHFWAKPTTFDFTFCQSYFKQFEVYNPFHFRNAICLNSYLRGLSRSNGIPEVDYQFEGDAHDAIIDVLNQIGLLFAAQDTIH